MAQWAVLVFKVNLVLLVSKGLVVARETRVTVVSVVPKVFVVRRGFLVPEVLAATRVVKVCVAQMVSLATVVCLEFKGKLVTLARWVPVGLVD